MDCPGKNFYTDVTIAEATDALVHVIGEKEFSDITLEDLLKLNDFFSAVREIAEGAMTATQGFKHILSLGRTFAIEQNHDRYKQKDLQNDKENIEAEIERLTKKLDAINREFDAKE